MLKANRGFAGDFFSFGFWLQQAWWLRVPPVDLEFSNSSVLQSFRRKLTSTACSPLETYGVWSGLLWVKAGPGTCQACFAS
ncbi:unnamed protein product [Brassica oleracea]